MTDRLHITPGRFQPPHGGHALTINSAIVAANRDKADHWVVPSRTEGNEQNPIPFDQKIALLQRLFPGQTVVDHPDVKNLFGALRHAAKHGYRHITVHAGEGRAQEYQKAVAPYIKAEDDPEYDPEKHLPFQSFQVIQSGKRDEAGEGVLGFSGTRARQSTRAQYRAMAPTRDPKLADEIYNAMRRGQAAVAKAKAAKKKTKGRRKLAEEISHEDFQPMLSSFSDYAANELKLKKIPLVQFKSKDSDITSFGGYNPSTGEIVLQTKNRHPMDIFRTLAHEFVHAKQHEDGRIGHDIEQEGKTGSEHENEANAMAGVIMRKFGRANPKNFELESLKEAIFVVGGPCSGKDKVVRLLKEQAWIPEFDISALTQRQPKEERIVVNAPAHDLSAIKTANEQLKQLNYKTSMIFVDVENNISKLRNEERATKGQRVINESVRFEKFSASKNNLEEFKLMFEDITIVDNSVNETKDYDLGVTHIAPKEDWKEIKDGFEADGRDPPRRAALPKDHPKHKTHIGLIPRHGGDALILQGYAEPLNEEEDVKKPTGGLKRACWKGYTAVGMKMKGGRKVPNCVPVKENFTAKLEEKRKTESQTDKDFIKFMEQPENREWGKTSTTEIYKKMTPGQFADDKLETTAVNVYPTSLHEKKKVLRKRLAQEAENCSKLSNASGSVGLPVSDSIGAEFGVAKSPSIISGLTGVTPVSQGATAIYPFGTYGISESVQKWMMKEETQQRFARKYGNLAEQKLIETGINITKNMNVNEEIKPKHFNNLREAWDAIGGRDSPMVQKTGKEDREVTEDWSDVKHQDPRGGLKASGVRAYRAEHPGSKLKTAVREDPSKLKKGGKRWKRRKSFCSRMKGMKAKLTSAKTARDPDSRINKSLRAWNCEE